MKRSDLKTTTARLETRAQFEKPTSVGQRVAFEEEHVARARRTLEARLPFRRAQELARMFAAFGDPTRLKLLHSLAAGELCVGDLSLVLKVSASAVSHQLRELRALHLVKGRRDGKMTMYSLDDEHVFALLDAGTQHIGEAHAEEFRRHRETPRQLAGMSTHAPTESRIGSLKIARTGRFSRRNTRNEIEARNEIKPKGGD